MKSCPFCAEQVQDTAIKCRHCGESLVPPEALRKSHLPLALAVIVSALFSFPFFYLAKLAHDKADQATSLIQAGFGIGFIVAGVIAWFIGDAFRRFAMPDMVLAQGAVDMAGKRLFWLCGPQFVAVFLAFCGVFYMAGEVAPLEKNMIAHTTSPSTPTESSGTARLIGAAPIKEDAQLQGSQDEIPAVSAADTTKASGTVMTTGGIETAEVTAAPESRPSPSFDCTKASGQIETMICASQDLSAADVQLSAAYKAKLGTTTDRQTLKEEQRRWVRDERNSCLSEACLMDAYRARIQALSQS